MEYVKQGDGIGALGHIFVLGTGVILSDVLGSNMLYKVNGIVLRHMKKNVRAARRTTGGNVRDFTLVVF